MTYRTAPPPTAIVELGPIKRPSTWLLLVVGALGIVPALVLVTGIRALHARHDSFGQVMAIGSLLGMLTIAWLSILGVLLGRRTRVRVVVQPSHLEVETRWGGVYLLTPRTLARVPDELARVVMAERGGRGSLPKWRIEYGGGTNDFVPLLTISAIEKPIALEHAAARARAALATIPRTA